MPKRKATFYGVRVGKQPGVYDDWNVCKAQVDGFRGCQYKGFSTHAEAENYVKDCLTGDQNIAMQKTEIIQSKENKNLDERCSQFPLQIATSKKHTIQPCLQKVRTPKKEIASPLHPLKRATPSKEEVTSPEQLSTKDPSNYFKEIRSQEQTSDSSQDIQTKVTAEDDDFAYFKDEDELKSFLEPYLKNAQRNPSGPAQVYQRFDAVVQASFFARQGIYQIEFDGASKGNPGLAGAGALIRCPHGSVVLEMTEFLGSETNNVAEYRALILGLKAALSNGMRRVTAQGDSKLVCLQVTGAWRVGNEKLISLHKEVKGLEKLFEDFSIVHIRREYNSAADALANEAVYLREPAREVAKPIPECCL